MPRWEQNVERTGVSCYVQWGLCRRRLLKMRGVAWKGGLQPFDLSQVSNITMEELQPGSNIPSVVDLSHQIMFFTAGTSCRVTRVTTSSRWFLLVVRWPLRTTGFMVWHTMGWLGYVVMLWFMMMVFGFSTAWYGVNRKHFRAPENLEKWLIFSFPSFSLYKVLRAERCF